MARKRFDSQTLARTSKYLSLILRHRPGSIGLTLDAQGWAEIGALIEKADIKLTRSLIEEVVATSEKQRFALSADGLRIRANQGHSVAVDLGLAPVAPPPVLYHGTATRFLDAILAEGLKPMDRQKVHLSSDVATATAVGRRHGAPVVLTVDSAAMATDGHVFTCSENGVWLTDSVPPRYLSRPAG